MQICAEEKRFREKHNMMDISMHGDMEGWRNETLCAAETGFRQMPWCATFHALESCSFHGQACTVW